MFDQKNYGKKNPSFHFLSQNAFVKLLNQSTHRTVLSLATTQQTRVNSPTKSVIYDYDERIMRTSAHSM
jgi:hypothetical protein